MAEQEQMKSQSTPEVATEGESSAQASHRAQRRRAIRAAIAAVPVVMTLTAGPARAQSGSNPSQPSN